MQVQSTAQTNENRLITGLHHVTALSTSAQSNVDFYAGLLGLRLVKKTVNFDAPDVYHLYYGDEEGQPGSIMTFFPFGQHIRKGLKGKGQLTRTAFSIPSGSVSYWLERFESKGVSFQTPWQRFEETVIPFEDPDGLGLELVANDTDQRPGFTYGEIPLEHSVRGFYGVTLSVGAQQRTLDLLVNHLDYTVLQEAENRVRLAAPGVFGSLVDLLDDPKEFQGIEGGGIVHHLAFATPEQEQQLAVRERVLSAGLSPTPIIDRQYFRSIYFREPNGILFEVATNPPGFAVDEAPAHLGEALKLPPQYEGHRQALERSLEPIALPQFA